MSIDTLPSSGLIGEARRQVEICNACRYCEGFCSVFPAITRQRTFAASDITQLANLCHNCRGCHYACQYSDPHEFAVNLPRALAEVRAESWERFAWPGPLSRTFQQSGVALAAVIVAGIGLFFLALQMLQPDHGAGFYAHLSHSAMIAIFIPAFLLPMLAIAVGLRRYWREVGGSPVRASHLLNAFGDAARLRNLDGGQGQGCNFEKGDRFSMARRHAHQAAMWGFLLCFASTVSGTLMHYALDWPAPYALLSPPKLLGVPGGILLVVGSAGLAWLKVKAERDLGAPAMWGGEMAFVLLLAITGATGLALYAAAGTTLVGPLLAIHLGAVCAFFLTMPYSKMAHGFYRFAALVRDAQAQNR